MDSRNLRSLDAYVDLLVREEKSPATIEKYRRDILSFLRFAGDREWTKELVISYKAQLLESGYAATSINSMLASMNGFLDHTGHADLKVRNLKVQRKVFCSEERMLTRQDYEKLVATARRKGKERTGLILETICATGVRVSELSFITAEAVKRGYATVSCKGKTRDVFLVRRLQKKLLKYMRRHRIVSGPVFVTRSGRALDRTAVWRDMKSLCEAAGVDERRVFPHNLRHLFARVFYELDKDIAKLADILGHSSIETTRIYIVSTGAEHRDRMEQMRLII